MTSMKTVLLGSAAAIVATGAAQAADLPVKKAAAAVQYVEVCPVYGIGFYKLPGTDMCIRHFGYLKINIGYAPSKTTYDPQPDVVTESSSADNIGWQWSTRPGWDVRSPTEWGTLRTVVQLRMDQRSGIFERVSPRNPFNDGVPAGTGAQRPTAHRAYIEWAGFTFGRQSSQFVYWDQDDVISAVGGDPKTTATQFTYTAAFGGGLKATIGLEDSLTWTGGVGRLRGGVTLPGNTAINSIGDGPQRMWDVVATLSTDQSWGSAKLSGAIHQIQTIAHLAAVTAAPECAFVTASGGSCPTVNDTGWAALLGVTLKLPSLGGGDQLLLQVSHGNGAVAYAGVNGGSDSRPSSFERNGQWSGGLLRRGDNDAFCFGNAAGTAYSCEKEKATGIVGQYRHYWNPMLRSNLSAGYTILTPGNVQKNTALTDGGLGNAKVLDLAANLIWGQNRKTAEIGVEVLYKKVKQDLPTPGGVVVVPAPILTGGIDQNPSTWGVVGFIQRNW
jgi:hypothetical protein